MAATTAAASLPRELWSLILVHVVEDCSDEGDSLAQVRTLLRLAVVSRRIRAAILSETLWLHPCSPLSRVLRYRSGQTFRSPMILPPQSAHFFRSQLLRLRPPSHHIDPERMYHRFDLREVMALLFNRILPHFSSLYAGRSLSIPFLGVPSDECPVWCGQVTAISNVSARQVVLLDLRNGAVVQTIPVPWRTHSNCLFLESPSGRRVLLLITTASSPRAVLAISDSVPEVYFSRRVDFELLSQISTLVLVEEHRATFVNHDYSALEVLLQEAGDKNIEAVSLTEGLFEDSPNPRVRALACWSGPSLVVIHVWDGCIMFRVGAGDLIVASSAEIRRDMLLKSLELRSRNDTLDALAQWELCLNSEIVCLHVQGHHLEPYHVELEEVQWFQCLGDLWQSPDTDASSGLLWTCTQNICHVQVQRADPQKILVWELADIYADHVVPRRDLTLFAALRAIFEKGHQVEAGRSQSRRMLAKARMLQTALFLILASFFLVHSVSDRLKLALACCFVLFSNSTLTSIVLVGFDLWFGWPFGTLISRRASALVALAVSLAYMHGYHLGTSSVIFGSASDSLPALRSRKSCECPQFLATCCGEIFCGARCLIAWIQRNLDFGGDQGESLGRTLIAVLVLGHHGLGTMMVNKPLQIGTIVMIIGNVFVIGLYCTMLRKRALYSLFVLSYLLTFGVFVMFWLLLLLSLLTMTSGDASLEVLLNTLTSGMILSWPSPYGRHLLLILVDIVVQIAKRLSVRYPRMGVIVGLFVVIPGSFFIAESKLPSSWIRLLNYRI